MNKQRNHAFTQEMARAKHAYQNADYSMAFYHLERAHILGQQYTIPHTVSHVWMWKVGWKQGDAREVIGQIPRILASLLISRLWVPLGNTGGANVSPFKAMPIPNDLRAYFKDETASMG